MFPFRKKIYTFLFMLTIGAQAYAIKGSVTGIVTDGATNSGIPGAVIEIESKDSSAEPRYYTSGYNGRFSIDGLEYGDYKATVSFLGYDNTEITFTLQAPTLNLGTLVISESPVKIDAVVKEVVSMRTVQKGDTLAYNADAFKGAMDADLSSLLNKMPGITVSGNTIEAHGETIRSVYVDGSEFFGGSVAQALQTLPAQAIDRIEVYDRLSETAQVTGIADGGGGKVINIVTRSSMKHSQFGKMHVGYGYEPDADPVITSKHKYTGGGAVNIFDGDRRMTVMGLVNNLNKQNFSSDDISISSSSNRSNASRNYSVNTQSGVGESQIFAFNLNDKWGRRKNVKFDGSLFFNHTNAKNRYTVDRWYEAPAKVDTMAMLSFSNPDNNTARFRARIDWRIKRNHNMVFIPNITYTNNASVNVTNGQRWGVSGYRLIPSGNNGWYHGFNMGLYGRYSVNLKKRMRLFLVDFSVWRNHGNDDRDYWSNGKGRTDKKNPMLATIDTTYTRSYSDTKTYGGYVTMNWREPLTKYSQISFIYRPYINVRERDYNSFSTDNTHSLEDAKRNPYTSSDAHSSFSYHRAGVAYRYARKRNWFTLSAFYQFSQLANRDSTIKTSRSRHGYHNAVYNATLQWSFDKRNSLRVSLNSEVKPPSMGQLQDFYNVSNSQYISRGNSSLRPFYEQTAFIRYTRAVAEKGRTFMAMFQMKSVSNCITSSIEFDPTIEIGNKGDEFYKKYTPIQFSQPINMNRFLQLTGRISFGVPLTFMRSNLNLTGSVNYTSSPTRVDGKRNTIENMSYTANIVLGSNISENVDFTASWNGTYNTVTGSLEAFANDYFSHKASAQLKVVLPLGFTLTANCLYTQYIGITNGFNDSFVLLNAWLGKQLFRNKLAEIQIGVNDILNNNMSFGRYVWTGYSQMRYNTVIGRYVLIRFTYNLRHFSGRNKDIKHRSDLVLKMIQDPFSKTK